MSETLVEGTDVLAWLKDLLVVICDTSSTPLLDQYSLLPTQAGSLGRRPDLLLDEGIGNELKEIAKHFGLDLYDKLLDPRAAPSDVADLLAPKTEEDALDETLHALHRMAEHGKLPLDVVAHDAALFWWLVKNASYRDRLEGLPLVSAEEADGMISVVELKSESERPPLAPSVLWAETARPFANLFPRRKMLHAAVAGGQKGVEAWKWLADRGFVRLTPLYRTRRKLDRFLAEDPELRQDDSDESHEAITEAEVSDVAFLTEEDVGLIDTARKSKRRAVQLMEFILRSVLEEDATAFDKDWLPCECGESHAAFRAAWLIPLRDRRWIPVDGRRSANVSAHALAGLLAERGHLVDELVGEKGSQLLRALGVSPADFQLRVIAPEEDQQAALVRSIGELARATGGDIERVEALVGEIRDYPEILDSIEEKRAMRATVERNQRLGRHVEDLLKEALQERGLRVERTGAGSDFEVDSDFTENNEEVWLKIVGPKTSILVEVKSTRSDRVRMTPRQAIKAHEERDRFALCVVPLDETEPSLEAVRDGSRFVFGIGLLIEGPLENYRSIESATALARQPEGPIDVEITEGQVRFAVDRNVWSDALNLDAAVDEVLRRARH